MSGVTTMYGGGRAGLELPARPLRPLRGGALALDLANSAPPNEPDRDELSPGYGSALAWLVHAGRLDESEANTLMRRARRNARDAAAVRRRLAAFRDAVRDTIVALCRGEAPASDALDIIDAERLEAERHGRYTVVDRRLAWRFDVSTDLDQIVWPIAREAVQFLQGDLTRVRACASPSCDRLFLDTSKNGSRRFCDPATCGNTARVRRFRERHRLEPAAEARA